MKTTLKLILLTAGLGQSVALLAEPESHTNEADTERVLIYGRASELNGEAASANEGQVSGKDLLTRPMLKVAELLEAMPGMVAVQHSGSGKANQYFLRGFNLDHGTDFFTSIDGVPVNLPSHGHGHGYLDINGLITETVDRVAYRKGPYYASGGDFSLAGSSSITTIDHLPHAFISAEAGSYGWHRFAIGNSLEFGGDNLTFIAETKGYNGPWQRDENLKHNAIWLKYAASTSLGELTATLSGYNATWQPTEQIPQRAIGSAVCQDAFCALDSSSTGKTHRWIASASLLADNWQGTVYAQFYDWEMESNPTYDYQINQSDKRFVLGGWAESLLVDSDTVQLTTGASYRGDFISPVGLAHHEDGKFVETLSKNDINQHAIGLYSNVNWNITSKLRLLGGLRADHYEFDVTALSNNAAQGTANDNLLQPKIGAAFELTDYLEWYANWGKGFHSNDARGIVNGIRALSAGYGKELGARLNTGWVKWTATYWWLDQDSELIFVGDSNSVEPKGGSNRQGYEITAFAQPLEGLAIDASYTSSKARYKDSADGVNVENAIEESAQLGISYLANDWEINARLRYLGPYALTSDNSQRAKSLTNVSIRGSYMWNSITLYGEVINLLDTDRNDITYYYPAYIAGLDPANLSSETLDCTAVNCTMGRITEPRSLRVGLKYEF